MLNSNEENKHKQEGITVPEREVVICGKDRSAHVGLPESHAVIPLGWDGFLY